LLIAGAICNCGGVDECVDSLPAREFAVADEQVSGRGSKPATDFGATFQFSHIFKAEIDLINKRRARDPRGTIKLEHEAKDVSGEWVWRPPESTSLVGLALSGGGIRSAAFCLGALQALHETRVLNKVDYMSTVSGGGYIGCSLTAALESTAGSGRQQDKFPFPSRLEEDEPPALQHIRDHSNYLFPGGSADFLYNAAVYARGLVVNAVLVASGLLAAAGVTLAYYSVREVPNWPAGWAWHPWGCTIFF
jgi:Patatin-like phospholipase